jgi:uncharacterized protein
MKDKKIIIAGGTGFIGQALCKYFGKENRIIVLSRAVSQPTNNPYHQTLLQPATGFNVIYRRWDGDHLENHWASELEAADLVINLSGKSVNCRYTKKNKEEIFRSRIQPTRALGAAIRNCTQPPKLWINAASATIYRHAQDRPQDEYTGEFHNDFSVQVCKSWEQAFYDQRTPFTRKIALRTSITLGNGGVMVPYLNLLKFGLGGKQGNGKQMCSWVHIEDVCATIAWMMDHSSMEGTYNCTAPQPLNNIQFMKTLRDATGHFFGLPAYEWMLNLGTRFIGTEKELILKSRWVLPTKLLESGYHFHYPDLAAAVKNIIDNTHRKHYHLF